MIDSSFDTKVSSKEWLYTTYASAYPTLTPNLLRGYAQGRGPVVAKR